MLPRILIAAALLASGLAALPATAGAAATPRIVGGTSASINNHPYQVGLSDAASEADGYFFCGGTIVDSTHVVTAAHCVLDDSGDYPAIRQSDINVNYGKSSPTNANGTASGAIAVSQVAVDPRYKRRFDYDEWDSALLTLSSALPLQVSGAPQAIPVADDSDVVADGAHSGTVTGYGNTTETNDSNRGLRKTDVTLLADASSSCTSYGSDFVPGAMLCAGDSSHDSCFGDSGGPLVVDTDGSSATDYKLAGIVSFGNGCAEPGYAGIYTEATAPTTKAFLASSPPAAPGAVSGDPTISGNRRVGGTVTCNPPASSGVSPTQYRFYGGSGTDPRNYSRVAAGSSSQLTVPSSLAGKGLSCDVRYENGGGFAYLEDLSPVTIAAAPTTTTPSTGTTPSSGSTTTSPGSTSTAPAADTTRPKSRITKVKCKRRRCIVSIRASDTGGVRRVGAKLVYRRRVCHGSGAGRSCRTKTLTKRLTARGRGRGIYRARTGRLSPRRYKLVVRAVDKAGNRQRTAATKRFRVRR